MNSDGYEWMNDWYQADYYKSSPESNPSGLPTGKWRVAGSAPVGDPVGYYNNNLTRNAGDPLLATDSRDGKPFMDLLTNTPDPLSPGGFSWRCVVNAKSEQTDSSN